MKPDLIAELSDTSVAWTINGTTYECARRPGLCPECGAQGTITELPRPIREQQPDGTLMVCHPVLGGCDIGFGL